MSSLNKRFLVTGLAFVPVKVRIEISAHSAETAMVTANRSLKTGIRDHIVIGSEDNGAAFGFDALNAEEIKDSN